MRMVGIFAGLATICLVLSFWVIWLLLGVAFFVSFSGYFGYARFRLSRRGGNVQARVRELVLAHLKWDGTGRAIDIGCGNVPLTVKLAGMFPDTSHGY